MQFKRKNTSYGCNAKKQKTSQTPADVVHAPPVDTPKWKQILDNTLDFVGGMSNGSHGELFDEFVYEDDTDAVPLSSGGLHELLMGLVANSTYAELRELMAKITDCDTDENPTKNATKVEGDVVKEDNKHTNTTTTVKCYECRGVATKRVSNRHQKYSHCSWYDRPFCDACWGGEVGHRGRATSLGSQIDIEPL
jgi:hypothetical protein